MPRIVETISSKKQSQYLIKAEIVSYQGGRPILSFNRYIGKIKNMREETIEYVYEGRPGFDLELISWVEEEKIFEKAAAVLEHLDA